MIEVNTREPVAMNEKIYVGLDKIPDESDCCTPDFISTNIDQTEDTKPNRVSLLVPIGKFSFKYRNIISPLVFCVLALINKPLIIAGNRRLDMYLDIIGFSIALVGQLLRICVIGFAYIKRGGRKREVYADTLVQEGLFAHCRNPLYVGNILTLLGLIIIHNGILMYVICLPFFLFLYLSITITEENYLRQKFGIVYDDYTRRVPRFLISFKGLGYTLKGMKYDWKKVIRKEYGTTFVFVTAAMALLVWERITGDGLTATRSYLNFMFVLWVPVVLAYLAAFAAKKTGALGRG
jgi:protein-S-isoprenylcysteine O-methyltransferase Ste14